MFHKKLTHCLQCQFHRFSRVIMGWDHIDVLKTFLVKQKTKMLSLSRERVEEVDKNANLQIQDNKTQKYANVVKKDIGPFINPDIGLPM